MKLWIPPSRTDLVRPGSALSESNSRVSTPSPDLLTPLWMKPLKLVSLYAILQSQLLSDNIIIVVRIDLHIPLLVHLEFHLTLISA